MPVVRIVRAGSHQAFNSPRGETRAAGLATAGLAVGGFVRPGLKFGGRIVCSHFKTAQSSIPCSEAVTGRRGFGNGTQHQTLGIW